MSVRKTVCTLLPCLTLALVSSVALSADNPHPNGISSIAYGGSGCPQGTVGQSISGDRQVATLIFDSSPTCTLRVSMVSPSRRRIVACSPDRSLPFRRGSNPARPGTSL